MFKITRSFRKNPVSEERVWFRIYLKKKTEKKFWLYLEVKSKEEVFDFLKKKEDSLMNYEYNIKKVEMTYTEDMFMQTPTKNLLKKLPEMSGIF